MILSRGKLSANLYTYAYFRHNIMAIDNAIKMARDKQKAILLFKSFHERMPKRGEIALIKQSEPEYALEVGEVYGIMYKVKETKEPYLHRFPSGARPKLFIAADGKQTYVLYGKYRFTNRGFVG